MPIVIGVRGFDTGLFAYLRTDYGILIVSLETRILFLFPMSLLTKGNGVWALTKKFDILRLGDWFLLILLSIRLSFIAFNLYKFI